ncbi:MAG: hypothetical protein BWK79_07745 [Beggiatoa sp. IS2]|nr:MAG: hypothetical protein BWK79_07745 [Beggiatoa sp. IS2]
MNMKTTTLAYLKPGDTGIIAALHTTEEQLYRRLVAIGFRAGKRIEMIRSALAQGPLHVRIGTTEIMLRRADAQNIEIALSEAVI